VLDATRRESIPGSAAWEDLLVPLVRGGRVVGDMPPLEQARERARRQLADLDEGVKRLVDPQRYPVGLEERLNELKTRLIGEAREAMEHQ
jgi:nicotinate phosphoribosyltransferase